MHIDVLQTNIHKNNVSDGLLYKEKTMIYFILNRYQVIRMKDIVHDIDPAAYITISEVADVFHNAMNEA